MFRSFEIKNLSCQNWACLFFSALRHLNAQVQSTHVQSVYFSTNTTQWNISYDDMMNDDDESSAVAWNILFLLENFIQNQWTWEINSHDLINIRVYAVANRCLSYVFRVPILGVSLFIPVCVVVVRWRFILACYQNSTDFELISKSLRLTERCNLFFLNWTKTYPRTYSQFDDLFHCDIYIT